MKPNSFESVYLPKNLWVDPGYFFSHTRRPNKYKSWFGPNHEPIWVHYPYTNDYFPIDKEIFPILRAMWACDITTGSSCQDGHICFTGDPHIVKTILNYFIKDVIIVFDGYLSYVAYWGNDKLDYLKEQLGIIPQKEDK